MSADMQEYSRQLNLLVAVSCFKQVFALFFGDFSKQSIKLARLAGWLVSAQQLAVPLMATLGRKENLCPTQSLSASRRKGWQETGTGT
jgi:hypothetical protein